MAVRRFELVNEEHSKYWECSVKGTNFVVHYGRIGSDGQESVKEFESKMKATIGLVGLDDVDDESLYGMSFLLDMDIPAELKRRLKEL